MVEVEIKLTDTAVKQCTQALIDCGTTGYRHGVGETQQYPYMPSHKADPHL
jgi:hypothetical protein